MWKFRGSFWQNMNVFVSPRCAITRYSYVKTNLFGFINTISRPWSQFSRTPCYEGPTHRPENYWIILQTCNQHYVFQKLTLAPPCAIFNQNMYTAAQNMKGAEIKAIFCCKQIEKTARVSPQGFGLGHQHRFCHYGLKQLFVRRQSALCCWCSKERDGKNNVPYFQRFL
jgi:hypothetical protein